MTINLVVLASYYKYEFLIGKNGEDIVLCDKYHEFILKILYNTVDDLLNLKDLNTNGKLYNTRSKKYDIVNQFKENGAKIKKICILDENTYNIHKDKLDEPFIVSIIINKFIPDKLIKHNYGFDNKNIIPTTFSSLDELINNKHNSFMMNIKTFINLYKNKNTNTEIIVLGGKDIYNYFLTNYVIQPNNIYLFQYLLDKINLEKCESIEFMNHEYYLENFTNVFEIDNNLFRLLKFSPGLQKSNDTIYFDLAKRVLQYGSIRENRTNIRTISIFSTSMRFHITDHIPLMTTRYIPFNTIVEELLWFCRGDTDAKILQNKKIRIWDGNSSRAFLDNRGLTNYPEGVLGPIYGFQWRHFGANYDTKYANTTEYYKNNSEPIGGFDQLKYIIDLLKNDPFSRRIILSAWNPADLNKMALPPCHVKLVFRVDVINGKKYLSCKFSMRSSDFILAACYNVVSYSILTYILALKCDMIPHEIIYDADDIHIYENHIEQTKLQMSREPRPNPVLYLNPDLKNKDWHEMVAADFQLIGYFPHPPIKMPMAV
jgi:thymidylate synthase